MSKYVIDSATLTDIADAIREKTLTTGAIAPGDMPALLKKYSKRDWLLLNKTMEEYDADNPWQVYDMIDFGDMTTIPAYACYGSSVEGFYNGVSGQQVTWIREQAFRGRDFYFPNSYLASVDFPKLERIDKEAFSQCLFTTLTIPECVIGERAFASCTDLATLTFTPRSDDNSIAVGAYAFSGCSSLANVNFADDDNSLTVEAYAFSGCSNLANINFANHKIGWISEHAFDGAGLTTVTVPPVHNWEDYVFANCKRLTTVYIKECADWMQFLPTTSPPGTHTFTGCDALTDIYVTWGEDPDWGAPWGATNATVHYNWAG